MAKSTLDIILGYTDKLTGGLKKTLSSITSFAKKATSAFHSIGEKFKSALLSPQTLVSAGFVAIGAKITQWALTASGDMEMLQAQLETVMTSTEEAADALQESLNFSVKTPFKPDEIVQTRILLESVGVSGGEAVEAVAEAAGAMNRNITDVATAVMSMETEPLRRLGIGLTRNAGEFAFTFKNKLGEAVTATASSFEEAQGKVLDIFMEKFAGGVEKMAGTWDGLKSTLSGVKDLFFADLGDGFMPQAKQIVQDMIDLLNAGIDSGKIKEMGETIGQWIQKVRDDAVTVLEQIKSLDDVKTVLEVAAGWLKDKLIEGGTIVANKLAEVAPVIGSKISEAMGNYIAAEKEGEKRASQEMFGTDAPSVFSKAYWGLDSDYNAATREQMGVVARENTGAAQIEISDTSQQSLAERITAALTEKADSQSREFDLTKVLASGPTAEQLDEVMAGVTLTGEQMEELFSYMDDLAESTEATTDSASETTKAAKETAEAAKTAADAATESNEQVKTAMEKSAEASYQVMEVAQQTQNQVAQVASASSALAGQLMATNQKIADLEGMVYSLMV